MYQYIKQIGQFLMFFLALEVCFQFCLYTILQAYYITNNVIQTGDDTYTMYSIAALDE